MANGGPTGNRAAMVTAGTISCGDTGEYDRDQEVGEDGEIPKQGDDGRNECAKQQKAGVELNNDACPGEQGKERCGNSCSWLHSAPRQVD
jgi:hypothetical protein